MTKVRYCIECKFYKGSNLNQARHDCTNPKVKAERADNLITGKQPVPNDCASARAEGRECGPNGWLWESAQ